MIVLIWIYLNIYCIWGTLKILEPKNHGKNVTHDVWTLHCIWGFSTQRVTQLNLKKLPPKLSTWSGPTHKTFPRISWCTKLLIPFLLLLKLNCFYGLYRMEWMNETIWNNRAKSCKWDKNCIKSKQSESYFLPHSFVHLQLSGLTQNENDMNGHWTSNNHNFEERKHRHLPVLGYFFTHVSFAYGWMHELMS